MEKKMSVSELKRQYESQAAAAKPVAKKPASASHKKAKAKKVFEKFDTDGSGDIDVHEFQVLAFELGLPLTDSEAADFIKEIDRDGNGTIDFEEFYTWWSSDKKLENSSPERAKQLQILKIKLQSKAFLKNAAVLTNTLASKAEKAKSIKDSTMNSYDMEFFTGDLEKVESSISWNHTVSAEAANKLRTLAKAGEQAAVVVINVQTKAGVDPFELGEIGGSVKAILDLAKDELKYHDFTTGFTKEGDKNLFQLIFSFTEAELPPLAAVNAIVDALKISQFSIVAESSDKIGSTRKGFPEQRIRVKLDVDSTVLLELANSLPPDQKKGLVMLAGLRRVHFSMHFADMNTVITPELFPEHFLPTTPHSFAELRQFFIPPMAEVLTNEELPGQFVELYETCLRLLSGLDSVKVALGTNLFSLQLEGFPIFEGYLPNVEALRNIKNATSAPPGLQLIPVGAMTDGDSVPEFDITNITNQIESLVHSTVKEKNVNLIFVPLDDEPTDYTLGAVLIRNPVGGFTSPVKNVLVWALPTQSTDFTQFEKYNDFTKEQFEADKSATRPLAFIEVPPNGGVQYSLDKWATGKSFFVKMVDAHGPGNIDVEFIGLAGFRTASAPEQHGKLFNPAQHLGVSGIPASPLRGRHHPLLKKQHSKHTGIERNETKGCHVV